MSVHERVYRFLLYLYPARFRDEFGRELQQQFRDEAAEVPTSRLWRQTVWDVVRSAPRQHWEEFLGDARHSLRCFAQTPGFSLMVLVTLALGIGANALVFSVLNTFLLQPPVFPDSDRLVHVWEEMRGNTNIVSAPNAYDWKQNSGHVFSGMGIFEEQSFNVSAGPEPEHVRGARVSAELFRVLGIPPMLGRTFDSDDERGAVVINHDMWLKTGAGPGQTIRVNGEPRTVVGVMPAHFRFPYRSSRLWTPLLLSEADRQRNAHSFLAIARLRPGIDIQAATAMLRTTADRLREQHKQDSDHTASLTRLADEDVSSMRTTMYALLAATALLLFMASANVANLLLARNSARSREFSVRAALGATPWRVVRQLVTESLILSLLGCAAGVALCVAGARALVPLLPPNALEFLPYRNVDGIIVDGRVLSFAVACAVLTALLCSIVPAWQMLAGRRQRSLSSAGNKGAVGPGGATARSSLVALEVALCLVVLTGAGLMIATLSRLFRVDPGFRADHVLTMGVSLPQKVAYGKPERAGFCRELTTATAPGVASMSAISQRPPLGTTATRSVEIAGAPTDATADRPSGHYHIVCPGFFRTMGTPRSCKGASSPTRTCWRLRGPSC